MVSFAALIFVGFDVPAHFSVKTSPLALFPSTLLLRVLSWTHLFLTQEIYFQTPSLEPQPPSLSHVMIYDQLPFKEKSLLLPSILTTHIAAQKLHPLSSLDHFLVLVLASTPQVSASFLIWTDCFALGLVTSFGLIDWMIKAIRMQVLWRQKINIFESERFY